MGVIRRLREASTAKRILEGHAQTLSKLTGKPTGQIYREMVSLELTPNEWADAHGIDPILLTPQESVQAPARPTPGSHLPQQRQRGEQVADSGAEDHLDELWTTVRLDQDASRPSEESLYEIGALQEELAILMAEPAPLLAEAQRMRAVIVELHDRGARVDADFVNQVMQNRSDGGLPAHVKFLTQDEFDAWQKRIVEEGDQPAE